MQTPPSAPPSSSREPTVAFISGGKLFYKSPKQDLRELHSAYVQNMMDRMERSRQLHGWKEGTSLSMSFTGRQQQGQQEGVQIQATSAQFCADNRVLYFLRDDNVGGLFEYDFGTGVEKRLLHKQNLLLEDLRLNADGSQLLCSQQSKNGTASIAVINADGSNYRELTAGDTVDSSPTWIPGEPHMVMYQSTGIARNPAGFVVAHGPASIQLANTNKGSVTPVLENPRTDYLHPRVGSDGSLYYIRRPYEARQYGPRNLVVDTLLFPFRLLRALFHYLNFFSLMYSRKPLTTASGPAAQADLKDILLKGKRIDAETALKRGPKLNGVRSLVPSSWQLIHRSPQGEERVLASHVASFDLAADGSVIFTNGYGVFSLKDGTQPGVLLRDKLITDVFAGTLDPAATAVAPVPAAADSDSTAAG